MSIPEKGETVLISVIPTRNEPLNFCVARVLSVDNINNKNINDTQITIQWYGNRNRNASDTSWYPGWIDHRDRKHYYANIRRGTKHTEYTNKTTGTTVTIDMVLIRHLRLNKQNKIPKDMIHVLQTNPDFKLNVAKPFRISL